MVAVAAAVASASPASGSASAMEWLSRLRAHRRAGALQDDPRCSAEVATCQAVISSVGEVSSTEACGRADCTCACGAAAGPCPDCAFVPDSSTAPECTNAVDFTTTKTVSGVSGTCGHMVSEGDPGFTCDMYKDTWDCQVGGGTDLISCNVGMLSTSELWCGCLDLIRCQYGLAWVDECKAFQSGCYDCDYSVNGDVIENCRDTTAGWDTWCESIGARISARLTETTMPSKYSCGGGSSTSTTGTGTTASSSSTTSGTGTTSLAGLDAATAAALGGMTSDSGCPFDTLMQTAVCLEQVSDDPDVSCSSFLGSMADVSECVGWDADMCAKCTSCSSFMCTCSLQPSLGVFVVIILPIIAFICCIALCCAFCRCCPWAKARARGRVPPVAQQMEELARIEQSPTAGSPSAAGQWAPGQAPTEQMQQGNFRAPRAASGGAPRAASPQKGRQTPPKTPVTPPKRRTPPASLLKGPSTSTAPRDPADPVTRL